MIFAPFLSGKGIWREQILVIVDSALYCLLAVIAVMVAPGVNDEDGDGGAMGSLGVYLIVSTVLPVWRHIQYARSSTNTGDTVPSGTSKIPPIIIPVEDTTPRPATLLYFIPVCLQSLSLLWLYIDPTVPNTRAIMLMLTGSWIHYAFSRGHGDHNGGKYVPTLFALILHLAAALSGTPPRITLSIHRALALITYFFTGFRKAYCTGLRWADGLNLQLMIGLQGLYHDVDHKLAFNFALASSRPLCRLGSLGVFFLQLLMPLFLVLDSMYPESHGLSFKAAFWLVMSFHAGNHVLWRINFFGSWCPALVALLLPMEQVPLSELWQYFSTNATSPAALAPACVVIVYSIMQMGHAFDEASEKLAKKYRKKLLSMSITSTVDKVFQYVSLWIWAIFEYHLLGDYYTAYWADRHNYDELPLACAVIKWGDGDESLLPACGDFYFRRHINAWIDWPKQIDKEDLDMLIDIRQSYTPGGSAGIQDPNAPILQLKLSTVLERIAKHFETSFLSEKVLYDIRKHNAKVYLRVREIAFNGTSLYIRRLWERELDLARRQ